MKQQKVYRLYAVHLLFWLIIIRKTAGFSGEKKKRSCICQRHSMQWVMPEPAFEWLIFRMRETEKKVINNK